MADPITWGLVLQNKVLLDKIKDLIGGIDVETPISDVLDELKTLINAVDDNVDGVSGKVDIIDGNVDLLLQGRIVKSVQRGEIDTSVSYGNSYATTSINISPIDLAKSVAFVDANTNTDYARYSGSTLSNDALLLKVLATNNTGKATLKGSWQVIEFY